jgi:hypothetical protein
MKLMPITLSFLLAAVLATAQSTGSGGQSQTTPPGDTAKPAESEKDSEKKKRRKKEKDAKGSQDTIDTSPVFTERVASDVLGRIREGLEGHSRRLMLSAFDDDKMDGYQSFEDQIDAFFNRYETFRVSFRMTTVRVEGPKGIVLVDADLEETPYAGGPPIRKRGQLRFELELGRKGWRVVDLRDRGFFS